MKRRFIIFGLLVFSSFSNGDLNHKANNNIAKSSQIKYDVFDFESYLIIPETQIQQIQQIPLRLKIKPNYLKLSVVNQHDSLTEWKQLRSAISFVESSYNTNAINYGNCHGILQITPIYIADVNRILGTVKYFSDDRFDKEKSFEMFEIYQNYYNPEKNFLKAIRLHNPTADDDYAIRIFEKFENLKQLNKYIE